MRFFLTTLESETDMDSDLVFWKRAQWSPFVSQHKAQSLFSGRTEARETRTFQDTNKGPVPFWKVRSSHTAPLYKAVHSLASSFFFSGHQVLAYYFGFECWISVKLHNLESKSVLMLDTNHREALCHSRAIVLLSHRYRAPKYVLW